MKKLIILILIIFILPVQAEVIKFEQGGASDSTGIVPRGKLQLEAEFMSYARQQGGSERYLYELGSTLFRLGAIDERLELRSRLFGLSFNDDQVGLDAISLGAKLGLIKQKKFFPETDLILDYAIPINNDFTNTNFVQFYRFLMDYVINKYTLFSNITINFANTERSNSSQFTRTDIPYVFGAGYSFTEKLNLVGEVFGTWSLSGGMGNGIGLGISPSYAFRDNLIGTFTALFALNDNLDSYSMNFGLVWRP